MQREPFWAKILLWMSGIAWSILNEIDVGLIIIPPTSQKYISPENFSLNNLEIWWSFAKKGFSCENFLLKNIGNLVAQLCLGWRELSFYLHFIFLQCFFLGKNGFKVFPSHMAARICAVLNLCWTSARFRYIIATSCTCANDGKIISFLGVIFSNKLSFKVQ